MRRYAAALAAAIGLATPARGETKAPPSFVFMMLDGDNHPTPTPPSPAALPAPPPQRAGSSSPRYVR